MSEGHSERLDAALEGRYRIESELGEGGMATVYLAQDVKHKRKVAPKILKPELYSRERLARRFAGGGRNSEYGHTDGALYRRKSVTLPSRAR